MTTRTWMGPALLLVASCSVPHTGTNQSPCPGGQVLCGSECVTTATNPQHCGDCNTACGTGQTCGQGACTCPASEQLCDNGCIDVTSDAAHCGDCETTCGTGAACIDRQCSCQDDLADCDGVCTDLQGDGSNCGACGVSCESGQVCSAGACDTECSVPGTSACGRSCVNQDTDPANCGDCGVTCAPGQACSAGKCRCAAGEELCDGSCVDTSTHSSHCGGCNNECSGGQLCASGSCMCPPRQTWCNTACTDTTTDGSNCGACGITCRAGESCDAGTCTGPAPATGGAPGSGGTGGSENAGGSGNSAGSDDTGGRTVTGGSGNTGGEGGTSPTGGANATGGIAGAGAGAGGEGTDPCGRTTFSVDTSLSDTIASVAIVQWSVDSPLTTASIEFGRDSRAFEYEAPVANPGESNRTLLLGMKPSRTYAFQIVATRSDGVTCRSDLEKINTGSLRNGIPTVQVETPRPTEVNDGFTVTCQNASNASNGAWALILDRDGDVVWWYRTDQADCSRARMSFDGQHMWMGNINDDSTEGVLSRVRMDGTGLQAYDLPLRHHDFALLPDGKIACLEYTEPAYPRGDLGCDVVAELDPETGESTVVLEVASSGRPTWANSCHANAINWWPGRDLYTVSVGDWNAILAFRRTGEQAWVFGGRASDFDGTSWEEQHQHHLLENGILLFNNSSSDGSRVLEYEVGNDSAELVLEYAPGLTSQTLGDAKRLPNGNTLATFSNDGIIHELNPEGQLVQRIELSGGIGYTQRRRTLYGPPPPFVE